MIKSVVLGTFAAVALGGVAFAAFAVPAQSPGTAPEQPRICKKVVESKIGSKPFDLCMTKAEWDAKKIADAKDPNRMVCRYEEQSGTRFRSTKVCMTAAEWWNQRQRDRQEVERIQMQTCVQGAGC